MFLTNWKQALSKNPPEIVSDQELVRLLVHLLPKAELLNETLFTSLAHAREALAIWMEDYNCASEHPSVYVIEEKRFC
jgi:hypothetical protein